MEALGRMLLISGLVLAAIGVVLMISPRVPWFGRLPGDVRTETGGMQIYAPFATMLVISVVATVLMWLVGQWRR